MRASKILNRALRHRNVEDKFQLEVLYNGWASVQDCIDFLRMTLSNTKMPWGSIDFICSVNWLYGVALDDEKSRFELAAVTDGNGIDPRGSNVRSIEYIRVANGHSGSIAGNMDHDSAYVPLTSAVAEDISCLCHKTKRENICSIFYEGLVPGGIAGTRRHTNLSPYLPHDPRNFAAGRSDYSYDTVIMFDKEALFRDNVELRMSLNGIVVTTRTLTSKYIKLIYVVPKGNHDERWVLYYPCLWNSVPTGGTKAPDADSSTDRPYYRDYAWEWKRITEDDSVACPNCRSFNPKGFTACVTCGCKYSFDVISGPSKVVVPSHDDKVNDEEATPEEIEAYARRVAAFAVRSDRSQTWVAKDHWLIWKEILNCLDWRYKWDHRWSREDNVAKIGKGGSRWHSGQHWDIPPQDRCERLLATSGLPLGSGNAEHFWLKHHVVIRNRQRHNAHIACIYVAGVVSDALEAKIPDLVRDFK